MPASSDRFEVISLRPWMPAENEPAEPKALMQSLQLTCSLTPSSTVPSTRLVIIWLKRWLARPPIDPPLLSAPVTGGGPTARCNGGGVLQSSMHSACANAVDGCNCISTSQAAAARTADAIKPRASLTMISAHTACRWDHRPAALQQ